MLIIKIIPLIWDFKQKLINNQINNRDNNQLMNIINQLDSSSIETSLSAINDLENLAQVTEYHWLIMNMLTNWIRKKTTNLSPQEVSINYTVNIQPVIQAAMTVIAKRDVKKDPENQQLDLSFTNLKGLNLVNAKLENSNLYQANLSQANLANANLSGSILSAANLSGANLNYVNLSGAILSAANLSGSNLTGANLQQANLYLASLKDANLCDTILDGANLRETEFSVENAKLR
jgi:uncharacterized protein YjbI with pentapeptide repeats